jgi:lysophospholipase L1-like esterase
MRISFIIFFISLYFKLFSQDFVIEQPIRFLALGDSYTIGSNIESYDSWPSQFIRLLEKNQFEVQNLSIIAANGWTTSNIKNALVNENPGYDYNLVSLLAGANNVYQYLDIEDYKNEFEDLLERAINIAGDAKKVFVISIPDFGYTPAFSSNILLFSQRIEKFNDANLAITNRKNVAYFDITALSRQMLNNQNYVSSDGLHPSAEMYALWVDVITKSFLLNGLNNNTLFINHGVNKINFYLRDRILFFKLSEDFKLQSSRLTIYSSMGKLIYNGPFIEEVNLQNNPSGIYVFRVFSRDQKYLSGKIFIK